MTKTAEKNIPFGTAHTPPPPQDSGRSQKRTEVGKRSIGPLNPLNTTRKACREKFSHELIHFHLIVERRTANISAR